MSSYSNSPKLIKSGLVLLDAASGAAKRTIALQYNPDTLTHSLQIKALNEGGDRSEVRRRTGTPVEAVKLNAEIDAMKGRNL